MRLRWTVDRRSSCLLSVLITRHFAYQKLFCLLYFLVLYISCQFHKHPKNSTCSGEPGAGEAGDPIGRSVELQAGAGRRWRSKHLQLHLQRGESQMVAGGILVFLTLTLTKTNTKGKTKATSRIVSYPAR